ncbi:sodium-dependent transporter [Halomonas elongata]|uniref:Transporter n=1 Tax=Halomonas elongata (strain ATCC 33173 / DSM 2581 / NBRC 15536 / NCIMB 2198 / 1H9) TaxID=768066 RepID=E1VCE3_HALED|nr:sodium-dependent transporter [Halomonas elongata]MBW5800298.1 sodium-dependent transporter [Halomonas elongata]MDL4861513.1 sodium-dependent transporter [Halomonas elongata]RAW08585.1 sodium-dependent transporter [Halomonas elongata]WBF18085.1 sodium-dependent transporter [Halomonas elongata]WPU46935.1 sodium-dependent transporter [Halomonas elongata DSM 2581]
MSKLSHAQWSSRLTFILAATGSAVGLGNIWKFPYMVGDSGGAAFVLIYLLCIALVGLPILVAEWLIGRRGQNNPANAMADLAKSAGQPRIWMIVGISGILGAFLILSFYSVIGGWSLYYTLSSVTGAFSGQDADGIGELFNGMLGNPGLLLLGHSVFMLLVIGIVARGVTKGLEGAVRTLMPALGVLLLVLVGYGMTTGHFGEALGFMFNPDFGALDGGVVLAAMGQAFFTLSLGMGIMMAYGSYLGKEVNLLKTARTVIILDTVVALVAGLAIFPIVFANGLDLDSGPGLIFVTLPLAFGNMGGGVILGLLFFLLLTFAALTSAISLLEPVVEFVEERTPLSRIGSTLVAGAATWALGIAALLAFNVWSDVLILGFNVFDFLDTLTSKYLLPLTGLFAIIFVGWLLDREGVRQELQLGDTGAKIWTLVSRFIAPLGVIVVFVSSL